jgi:alkanesulfonate monooxygenase SsuD/methylene tetrahydromethanopterin reductase-like flavin-dependent oxidoreductase (luciferase family)
VKFFAFHLMPYADLDPNYTEHYDSAWVTLPNSYYDREKGHKLYQRYIDELAYADELGFDGVGVNEHHQNAYGIMPVPGVIAGALAARTKRAKIAVLGRALPLLNNPLVVAEEYAMLDTMTGGRLIAGFVRGIGAEYHSWAVNPAESLARFQEANDLIVRAWTETGPFHFQGKYYDFRYVNTWPRPYQQPHPPVWIPSQGSRETIEWAAAPERKYTYLQTYSPISATKKHLDMYRTVAWEKYGYRVAPAQLGWMAPVYVGKTDESAYAEAKPHIEAFVNKFLRMPQPMVRPPGYISLQSAKAIYAAKAAQTGVRNIDTLLEQGIFICGSAKTVREKLLASARDLGLGNFLALQQFGTLPYDLTIASMERFASDVIPHIRERADELVMA